MAADLVLGFVEHLHVGTRWSPSGHGGVHLRTNTHLERTPRKERPRQIRARGCRLFARINDGFAQLREADPERWIVIDGTAPKNDVEVAIRTAVLARLNL